MQNDFIRCPLKFNIRGVIFKCDLKEGHTGNCISLPEYPNKVATVFWDKKFGYSDSNNTIKEDAIKEVTEFFNNRLSRHYRIIVSDDTFSQVFAIKLIPYIFDKNSLSIVDEIYKIDFRLSYIYYSSVIDKVINLFFILYKVI